MITKFKIFESISTNEIIKKIQDVIYNYDLEYFLIGNDIHNYYINSFNRREDGIYLDYDYYSDSYHKTINKFEKIDNLSPSLLSYIWYDITKNNRLDPAYLLETIGDNVKGFKTILKKTKEKIDFDNSEIFIMFYERNIENELMKKDFQNILFKTHPEALESFLASDTKILPEIVKKYNLGEAVEDYYARKNSEKYNL